MGLALSLQVAAQNPNQPVSGMLTGTNLQTGTYIGKSLQATQGVELQGEINSQPGFGVSAEGFSATIAPQPHLFGSWSAPFPWGGTNLPAELSIAIHTHVLPDGNVMSWQGHNDSNFPPPHNMGTDVYRWSPVSGNSLGPTFHLHWTNAFCTGHSFLPDGKLLIAGGHHSNTATYVLGLPHISIYDFTIPPIITANNSAPGWLQAADMQRNRWYPTNTTLSDGSVLITSGETEPLLPASAKWPELWENGNVVQLTGAPKSLFLYPWMFATANKTAFCAGPGPELYYLSTSASTPAGRGAWTDVSGPARAYGFRGQGTAVMFAPGRILVLGGSDGQTVTNTAEIIDLDSGPVLGSGYRQPLVTRAADLRYARHHANATVLPTGQVLVSGGSRVPSAQDRGMAVLPAELWTPPPPYGNGAAPGGTWTTMAAMAEARMYHSTAALLPDGRVLSAGGEEVTEYNPFVPNFNNHCTGELFSPPYLHQSGSRPIISYAPASVRYGDAFVFDSPDAASIDAVTWIRLSSVTHSFNMNQRFLRLPITARSATNVTTTAPTSPDDCPPGHYLVFALRNGVPSEGKVVVINDNACGATLDLTSSVSGGCTSTASFTVTGTNLGGNYHWFIDGIYAPAYDGYTSISVDLDVCRPQITVSVEALPSCGGTALRDSESATRGYCNPSGPIQFCE